MKCPIRKHDHDLILVKEHVQDGTGAKARTMECPTGRYRWFILDGKSEGVRLNRPRWGWRKL